MEEKIVIFVYWYILVEQSTLLELITKPYNRTGSVYLDEAIYHFLREYKN